MRKAALVLSGGASLGAAHIGALKILERKFEFDFLVGVSAGAIVAAAVACGRSAKEISELLHEQSFFRLAFDFSKNKTGFIRGEKILHLLRELFRDRNFEDLPSGTKLVIGTTDFSTGERVMISNGSIAEAVRASLSVPVLFEPFQHQGRWLIDGGFSQNFPLDIALEEYKGEKIIGIDVCSFLTDGKEFFDDTYGRMIKMRKILERSFKIMFKNQQHFPEDERVTFIRPVLNGFSTFDIGKLEEIERCGEIAASEV